MHLPNLIFMHFFVAMSSYNVIYVYIHIPQVTKMFDRLGEPRPSTLGGGVGASPICHLVVTLYLS